MKTKREIGMEFFKQGYNCSQAVVLTFAEDFGVEPEMAKRIASGFGGGMGRMREVCGAVSGMVLIAGLMNGMTMPKDAKAKKENYDLVQEMENQFREQNGSIICHELLGLGTDKPTVRAEAMEGTMPEVRTAEYYRKRPCAELVGDACEIIEDLLKR